MQGKADATGKQPKPGRRRQKTLALLHLPKAIPSDSIKHRIILPNGSCTPNSNPGMRRPANLEHRR
jgi:hypothetical protein